jgi:ABC-type multidrug transport system fused ATPase/permease subunit
MPAVAITDTGNMFGALEFSQYCAGKGVQPIVGCQIGVARIDNPRLNPDPIVLLAQNAAGLANLQRLSSMGFLETDPSLPHQVPFARIAAHAEGLILLTGGTFGPIGRLLAEGQKPEAERLLAAANANISVARKNVLPSIALTGTGGAQSVALASAVGAPAAIFNFGLSTLQPIFSGGRLRGIDLVLRRGEILGIAGVAGNGQSELLEVLGGIANGTGSVRLNGVALDLTGRHSDGQSRRRQGIAHVPEDRQHLGLIMEFTAWENMAFGYHNAPEYQKNALFMDNDARVLA